MLNQGIVKVLRLGSLFLILILSMGSSSLQAQEVLSPAVLMRGNIRQLRAKIEQSADDQQRYLLLVQLFYQLQSMGEVREVVEVYEQLLQTSSLADPGVNYQFLLTLGNFLESRNYPQESIRFYNLFLDRMKPPLLERYERFRSDIEIRRLGALLSSGAYRQAKTIALEILEATGTKVDSPFIAVLLNLADNDLLEPAELNRLEDILIRDMQFQFFLPRMVYLYVHQGRMEKASALLDRLLTDYPGSFLSLLDIADEVYRKYLGKPSGDFLLDKLDALSQTRGPLALEYDLIRVRWLNRMGRADEAYRFLESKSSRSILHQKELASLYFENRKFKEAALLYERLLASDPQETIYLRYLGESLYLSGDTERAIATWEKIPILQGQSAASLKNLAEIYQGRGLYSEAISALKRAQEKPGGGGYEIVSMILDLEIQKGDDESLLREYVDASMKYRLYEVSFRESIVLQMTEPDRAKRLLDVLTGRMTQYGDETRVELLRRLGTDLWVALGEYGKAIDFVKSAYQGNPDLGRQLSQLGFELFRQGANDRAIQAWGEVPRNSRDFCRARAEMAKVSLHLNSLDEARQGALDLIDYLSKLYPLPPAALASSKVNASTLESTLRILPVSDRMRFVEALQILAQVDLQRKKPGNAMVWLMPLESRNLSSQPGFVSLLLGHAYSQLGSLDTAQTYYEHAMQFSPEQSPERSEAEFYLAETFFWQEKIPEAMDRYHEIAKRAPQENYVNESLHRYIVLSFAGADQLYHYTLATLFEWKGDWKEAVRLYREAAADEAGGDVAGWCLYEVARMLVERGAAQQAERQIAHLLKRYDHPTLLAECRVLLAKLSEPYTYTGSIADATGPYVELMLDYPDSLYSDLSRLKLEGRLLEPF